MRVRRLTLFFLKNESEETNHKSIEFIMTAFGEVAK